MKTETQIRKKLKRLNEEFIEESAVDRGYDVIEYTAMVKILKWVLEN